MSLNDYQGKGVSVTGSLKVAIKGDIQATPSSSKHPGDAGKTGSWQASAPQEELGSQVTVKGKPVVIGATATFQYTGGTGPNNTPLVVPPEIVELVPQETRLKDLGRNVLTEDSEATGKVDANNTVTVTPEQALLRTR